MAQDPDHYYRPGQIHSHPSAGRQMYDITNMPVTLSFSVKHSQFVSSSQV